MSGAWMTDGLNSESKLNRSVEYPGIPLCNSIQFREIGQNRQGKVWLEALIPRFAPPPANNLSELHLKIRGSTKITSPVETPEHTACIFRIPALMGKKKGRESGELSTLQRSDPGTIVAIQFISHPHQRDFDHGRGRFFLPFPLSSQG